MRDIILWSFPLIYGRYIEVFGGGASVLFAKMKERFEVYNDFNGDLVNMFRCIKERPLALIKALNFLPLHSRQEFSILQNFLNGDEPEYPYMQEELQTANEYFNKRDAEEIVKILTEKSQLYDVERAAAFYKLIRYSYGIINGKAKGIFAPHDFITREEAATILDRICEYVDISGNDVYNFRFHDDEAISEWAKSGVYHMQFIGIMNGVGDDLFAQQDTYTVEQAILTMVRIYDYH